MKKYSLLQYHMNCNPTYMFGHAKVAGLLASSDNTLDTYDKYVKACNRQGINVYSEDCYNEFMSDCNRPISQPIQSPLNQLS